MSTTFVAGPALKAVRLQRGLKLRHFATQLGISSGYLADLEAGEKHGSLETQRKLAAALGVDLSEITYSVVTDIPCQRCHGSGHEPRVEVAA